MQVSCTRKALFQESALQGTHHPLVKAIKNILRRLLAGERHETVQPHVLLSLSQNTLIWMRNLRVCLRPKSDEPRQMGSRRSRPNTIYILRTYKRRDGA